ncbi:cullin-1-like [Sitodiplosis mosellana]|uniref:cullin-1-like n=1 Tax=Sitodiplosis mosellana TaxID=263140 RepID=UPI0024441B82|nr:cullin-1-like [Sitodiplosis mosellana]
MAGQQEERNNNDKDEKMRQIFLDRMKQIYLDRKMTKAEYMEFYTLIVDYCVKGKELNVWIHAKDNQATCGYKRINTKVKEFLDEHIKEISARTPDSDQDEICLEYYCAEWTDFQRSSKVLNGASAYLNKQHHKKDADAETIEQIALHTWRDHLFTHLNQKVANAALRMLERSRAGERINSAAIRAVVESYIELGILESSSDSESTTAHLTVYREFEKRVLEGTEIFYIKESGASIEKFYTEQHSFVKYMDHVKKRIDEEMKDRIKLLHVTTEEPLMAVLSDTLIKKHLELFDIEFRVMLSNEKNEDMGLMCSLAVKADVVLKRLNAILEEHVTKEGLDKLEKGADEAVKDPKVYIETILSVHKKYQSLVRDQFKNEIGFVAALDKACSKFINQNSVITKSGNPNKSPELLAAYCHILLKKSNKNLEEAELEDSLNQMLTVFRYIEDKDVFEVFYKKKLAERLIEQLSASDDAEASMISKMKHTCGYNYTNKLQRMYQDIAVSKDINDKFRQRIASGEPLDIDFRIQVLTHGSWPFTQSITLMPPPEMAKAMERFTAYYKSQQNGRQLNWLYNRSKGELLMKTEKQRYFIKANTFQMAILLQFNEQITFTAQQIHDNTGINKHYLYQMLALLVVKMKLLKSADMANITDSSVISLNTNYTGPKLRFDISGVRMKSEQESDSKATHNGIEEDRRHLIEAAIVRVMKMRKTLKHQILIGEVIEQLAAKFKPKIPAVKRCIDALIEKEYLERHLTEKDTYNYLA